MKTPRIISLISVSIALAPRTVLAASDESPASQVVHLSAFEVTADNDRGYGTATTLGATRMNLSILESAQTVVTLNEKFMEDTGLVEFEEIAMYVAGVGKASTQANGVMSMRGQEVGGLGLTDGLLENISPSGGVSIDMIGMARLEFIKGPAGALYGAHRVGGVVNRITKRPLAKPQSTLRAIADDYHLIRGELDTSNRLLEQKLGYRVAAAYQEGEMKAGNADNRRAIYSFLDYAFAPTTKVWTRWEIQSLDRHGPSNTFRAAAYDPADPARRSLGLGVIPMSTLIVGPGDNTFRETDLYLGEAGFEHTVDTGIGQWTFKFVGRYQYNEALRETYHGNNFDFISATGAVIGNQNTMIFEDPRWVEIRTRGSTYDALAENSEGGGIFFDLAGKLDLGPMRHQMLSYLSLSTASSWSVLMRYNAGSQNLINPRPLNLRVDKWQMTDLPSDLSRPVVATSTISEQDNFGFGLQDNITFFRDRLIFAGGMGYRWTRSNTNNRVTPANSVFNRKGMDWSPTYGLIYRLRPDLSIFANHSETFTPRFGVDGLGNALRNGRGESDEIGIKANLWKGRLTGTLSYFEIMEDGFIVSTVINGFPASVQAGEATNKGWEVDLAAQPIDRLSLILGVSDITGETQSGAYYRNANQGFNWSFFAKYDIPPPIANNFAVSIGYKNVADRFGDGANTFLLPGYDVWSAALYYQRPRWRAQLQVENVFDKDHVLSAVNQTNIYFGNTRRFRLITQYRF